MKQYTSPTCDPINVATNEVMTTGMSQIIIPINTGYDNSIIYDGKDILSNHSKLWEDEEEEAW